MGKRHLIVAVMLMIVLPLSVYLGSYYALLSDDRFTNFGFNDEGLYEVAFQPRYRVNDVEEMFWLSHQIDRKIRPSHWRKRLERRPGEMRQIIETQLRPMGE